MVFSAFMVISKKECMEKTECMEIQSCLKYIFKPTIICSKGFKVGWYVLVCGNIPVLTCRPSNSRLGLHAASK